MQSAHGLHAAPAVVLDTNVALDWLLFDDPGVAALAQAIRTGQLRWLSCPRMRDEFCRVLAYPSLAAYAPDSGRMLTLFDTWAHPVPAPIPRPTAPACTDTDDQVFVDLALASQARWLVTHDRALLKLARRARALGLAIVQPVQWTLA